MQNVKPSEAQLQVARGIINQIDLLKKIYDTEMKRWEEAGVSTKEYKIKRPRQRSH